jgi:hypothetical protein
MGQEVWTAAQARAFFQRGQEPWQQEAGRGQSLQDTQQLAPARSGGRTRHEPGKMNRLERAYFAQMLQPRLLAGEVVAVEFESVKLKLAERTYYTPDFFVVLPGGGAEVHEVKGHWEDDARVKWKVAAGKFWWWTFFAVSKKGGVWVPERYAGGRS